MLASMRKAIEKGLLQVVAWVTAISMIVFFSDGRLIDTLVRWFGAEEYVLSINKKYKLTKKEYDYKKIEFEHTINDIRKRFGAQAGLILNIYGLSGDLSRFIVKTSATELFFDMICDQFDVKFGKDFLKKSIFEQIFSDGNGNVNTEALNYALNAKNMAQVEAQLLNGRSISQVENQFKNVLKQRSSVEMINSGLFIPSFIVKAKYIDEYSPKKYAILAFDFNKYLQDAKNINITAEEMGKYYSNHREKYTQPESREVKVLEFDPANYGISISDSELKSNYEKNKQSYLQEPAKIQLRRILLKGKESDTRNKAIQIKGDLLKEPNRFEEYAKKYSNDKNTSANGGLMNFVSKDELEPNLAQAAFSLENDGQISDIISTEEGLELIQRIARKPASYKTLAVVEPELKEALLKSKFANLFGLDAKKIVKGNDNANSFAASKKAKAFTMQLTKSNKKISEMAFNIKEIGKSAYFIDGNKGYIVKLENITKSYVPNLDEVKAKVVEDILRSRADEILQKVLNSVKSEINSASLKDLAVKYGANLIITGFISSKQESEELKKLGLNDSNIVLPNRKDTLAVYRDKATSFIVKVVDIKPIEIDAKKMLNLEKDVYLKSSSILVQGFIASLAKTAKISISDEQFNKKRHNRK